MAHRGADNAYGDLAERRAKMDSKYDAGVEASLKSWISSVTGQKLDGSFQESLKDGTVLCKLINELQPGSVTGVYTGPLAFKQMENIGKFLAACPKYGVKSEDLFQSPDLYESVNLTAVQVCLDTVRRISELKKKGVHVEAQKQSESPFLKTGSVSVPATSSGPVKKHEIKYQGNDAYSAAGKDVANKTAGGKDGAFGDLAERLAKLDAKYDKNLENELKAWIEKRSGEKIGDDFQAGLKSGVILCKLMNAIKPGSIPTINNQSMAFKQMENINNFLKAATAFGVRSDDAFQTVALYEAANMTQVLLTLDSLRRIAK